MTPLAGFTAPPAGSIAVTDLVIPASSEPSFDVPVKFVVTKTNFNPALWYGATFTITSVSQGQFAANESSVDVIFNDDPAFNTSKFSGLYTAKTTVVDANNVYGIDNNTRPFMLTEGRWNPFGYGGQGGGTSFVANNLYPSDTYQYAFSTSANYHAIYANNKSTGANTAIVKPIYVLDGTGKVIDVKDYTTGLSLSPTFDASHPNSFVYTDNDHRTLDVKWSASLTLNAVTRIFTFTDVYTYRDTQATY
jgi:hypothetical protein